MIRKLLVFILATYCLCLADTTVPLPGASTIVPIAQNLPWSTYSSATVDYIFDSVGTGVGACVYVQNNNPANARTITLSLWLTGKMYPSTSTWNQAEWVSSTSTNTSTITVGTNSTSSQFFNGSGSPHMTLRVSNETGTAGGTPDTVSIFVVQTGSCLQGTSIATQPGGFSQSISIGPNQWAISSASGSGGRATVTETAVSGVRHTIVAIDASLHQTTAVACSGDLVVRDGASGSGTIIYEHSLAIPATAGESASIFLTGLQWAGTAGNAMTIEFGAASASGCFQRVNLFGFDQ